MVRRKPKITGQKFKYIAIKYVSTNMVITVDFFLKSSYMPPIGDIIKTTLKEKV